MPNKLIIIRHGETQYNVERRLQGWTDVPLNDNGHLQAQKLAQRLSYEQIHHIYSSDHQRAHTTATYIAAKHALKLHQSRALREDRMGIFEGWQWEQENDPHKQQLWDERIKARERGDIHWKPEGGESIAEHLSRVKKFLDQLETKHPDGTIALVSHGGTINRIIEIYGFKPIAAEYIHFLNTSVTVISKTTTGYRLDMFNDIAHII